MYKQHSLLYELQFKCTLSFSSGIPVVLIEYMATWEFYNVPPKECDNISILFSVSEEILGDMTKLCNTLDVCVNISFAYRTQTFKVNLFIFLSQGFVTKNTISYFPKHRFSKLIIL